MNILMVGAGKGSWQIRGQQLGAELGAVVTSTPTEAEFAWCDVVVLVKKHALSLAPTAHRFGKPIVWDALDFWAQPAENRVSEATARTMLANSIHAIKPALVICATDAMASACDGVYLPHHSRPGLMPTPARETVKTVAYEGNPAYLGRWLGWVSDACAKRRWHFVLNPASLSDADIVVAFRDGPWDGWICREWKSGVKVVNAIAAGRPLIGQESAACRELLPQGTMVNAPQELDNAFDYWADLEPRQSITAICSALPVSAVAHRYREILSTVGRPCAA